jgi:hypothetical protein
MVGPWLRCSQPRCAAVNFEVLRHRGDAGALRIVAPRADERERFAAAIVDVREELAGAVATLQPTPVNVNRVKAQTSSPGRLCTVVS